MTLYTETMGFMVLHYTWVMQNFVLQQCSPEALNHECFSDALKGQLRNVKE